MKPQVRNSFKFLPQNKHITHCQWILADLHVLQTWFIPVLPTYLMMTSQGILKSGSLSFSIKSYSDFKRTLGLLYSTVCYNMVLDIKLILLDPNYLTWTLAWIPTKVL